jgi:hypothetical protein
VCTVVHLGGGCFPSAATPRASRLIERALDDAAMLPASARQIAVLAPHLAREAQAAAPGRVVAALLDRHLPGAPA